MGFLSKIKKLVKKIDPIGSKVASKTQQLAMKDPINRFIAKHDPGLRATMRSKALSGALRGMDPTGSVGMVMDVARGNPKFGPMPGGDTGGIMPPNGPAGAPPMGGPMGGSMTDMNPQGMPPPGNPGMPMGGPMGRMIQMARNPQAQDNGGIMPPPGNPGMPMGGPPQFGANPRANALRGGFGRMGRFGGFMGGANKFGGGAGGF